MILPNLSILEFCTLPDDRREELEALAKYIKCPRVFDCKDWRFLEIKTLQMALNKPRDYSVILECVGYVAPKYKSKCYDISWVEVIPLFLEVERQISEISNIENNAIGGYNPTPKEIAAGIDSFERFGFYNQIRSISLSLKISISEVERMTWKSAFIELAYNDVLGAYLKKMNEV